MSMGTQDTKDSKPLVSVVMGSDSDLAVMRKALECLEDFGVPCEAHILSAHRTPREAAALAENAAKRGVEVIIAGAGMAAHLPGVLAAWTTLPVIGVPISSGPLKGQDALLAIVQMPPGIPVATVGIDGARNAGLLAVQILAGKRSELAQAFADHRRRQGDEVLAKENRLAECGFRDYQ